MFAFIYNLFVLPTSKQMINTYLSSIC